MTAPIGILAALHDEIADLLTRMGPGAQRHTIGMRDYYVGQLAGRPCVVVLARVGKVAAAATAVTLIREFGVSCLLFAGLAGGIASAVRVGDVVIAETLVQHDLDARPLFPRYEVPLLARAKFATDAGLNEILAQCAADFLGGDLAHRVDTATRERFGIFSPTLHRGEIASGDQFIGAAEVARRLAEELPATLCVEMEGAAVAQVCHEYGVPCAVLRTVSDRADAAAPVDFKAFLHEVASFYSAGIIGRFVAAV
ncbi:MULTISPECIES: 5'-methylthioadenosine/adenosylhomocysteine nucleosidase [unclassified Achromobacter]|uniref:5'-methylthioadenosine/adenosylhomocysteine nucleosidase n=1 Tax=unclassified Achromobacter TaxID=2626865 RepID=UPI000B517D15|nr:MULTISPECIES: 5'-methylthioadenosine/adenosylhomocysteine nucleosidase [unclassified Achromobacter]OWT74748.1 5'-methylthioadenosine/S-adenosylhomocysteine nucleosidase [Achromobacter sp. HZ34]OWT79215.1 5'-methylthioadenosine/S-adenosylhomocysteine nucleosidase [Achromobacter sp. HZ28]